MSMLGTLKEVLAASSQSTNRGETGGEESKGAYWCDDCDQRILDLDVEGEAPPACPECGDEMTFERSPGSTGCAC
jgi:Zn finger protein HypA/HybF involved in hydrogenase expression